MVERAMIALLAAPFAAIRTATACDAPSLPLSQERTMAGD